MLHLLRRLLPSLLLAAALPLATAQKSVIVPLVPASRWEWVSSKNLTLQDLQKYGSQVPVDREFGVKSSTERTYRLRNIEISAVLEEAADPSSAYGLYTFYQTESMSAVPEVQMAVSGNDAALMARGRYFIRVLEPESHPLASRDLRSLLITIGGARISIENAESLPPPLPQRGLVLGSPKYLLGVEAAQRVLPPSFPARLIGFEDGAEVQLGSYVGGRGRLTLCEISYPTPQLAQAHFKALGTALRLGSDHSPRSVYGRQTGSYVLLVLNSKSGQSATALLNQFKVAEAISWSPPYPKKGGIVYQMLELIIGNVELVVIILFLAILGGVTIFFTKKLILKLFPNSSWIRPDDDQLIRLKLS